MIKDLESMREEGGDDDLRSAAGKTGEKGAKSTRTRHESLQDSGRKEMQVLLLPVRMLGSAFSVAVIHFLSFTWLTEEQQVAMMHPAIISVNRSEARRDS